MTKERKYESTVGDQDSSAVIMRYREFATTIVHMISLDYVKAIRKQIGKKSGIIKDEAEARYIVKDAEQFFDEKLNLYLSNPDVDPTTYANMLKEVARDDEKFKNFKRFRAQRGTRV